MKKAKTSQLNCIIPKTNKIVDALYKVFLFIILIWISVYNSLYIPM